MSLGSSGLLRKMRFVDPPPLFPNGVMDTHATPTKPRLNKRNSPTHPPTRYERTTNDGYDGFNTTTEAVEGHSRNWHEVIEFGSRLALGGPAIGAVIGMMGAFVLGYVINDALVEVSLTVLLAFSTFALCEATRVKVCAVAADLHRTFMRSLERLRLQFERVLPQQSKGMTS